MRLNKSGFVDKCIAILKWWCKPSTMGLVNLCVWQTWK